MKKYGILIVVYFFLVGITVFAQVDPDLAQERQRREQEKAYQREREIQKRAKLPTLNANQRTEAVERRKPTISARERIEAEKAHNKEVKRIITLRAPNLEDSAKYKEFLKQSKTGLFRLFPDFDCETKNIVRADGDCANAVLGSYAYSFRKKDYVNSDIIDIRYKDGNLITDGFLSQGILVSLGDTALEEISTASSGMRFLVGFKPESNIQDAKKQYKQIADTIIVDGYSYGKSVKADSNKTYAVRVIAYRNDDKKIARLSPLTMSTEEKKFWDLESDKRIDLIVVFRIIRQEEDGNVTILWKELNRQQSPRISFQKNEELSNINPDK